MAPMRMRRITQNGLLSELHILNAMNCHDWPCRWPSSCWDALYLTLLGEDRPLSVLLSKWHWQHLQCSAALRLTQRPSCHTFMPSVKILPVVFSPTYLSMTSIRNILSLCWVSTSLLCCGCQISAFAIRPAVTIPLQHVVCVCGTKSFYDHLIAFS